MEPAGSGATWTGSPKGVFVGRKHHKPQQSLKNNTAGVRECVGTNRTREAGSRDEVEGVVANALKLFRNGAVGFIDWLGLLLIKLASLLFTVKSCGELKTNYIHRRRRNRGN